MTITSIITSIAITLCLVACVFAEEPSRTTFQIHTPWTPLKDYQADAAMIYGIDDTFPARLKSFKDHGYRTEFMTGVAWGNYADYVEGKFDGVQHMDDAQVRRDGTRVMHDPSTPYFMPSPSYRAYLKTKLSKAIDAGATAIYLEEPEFWAFAGYEESFKREYKKFYHEDWQPPHESVDARFRVDHLKYVLYRDTLDDLFNHAKAYAESKGTSVRCFVPTHSLISYAQIRMVSPMSSLMDLKNCDGYIAQVWTGTARHPNAYQGITKERTFETAYFEYAQMIAMTRPTGRTCYFLADPIEDDPNHGWDDYEANYKRTLVASLMQPDANHYEVAPWPDRVFERDYPATEKEARAAKDAPRVPISDAYASVLLTCFNALTEMPASGRWESESPAVGVLVSDTLMFQRDKPTPSDPYLNNFFGLALPLLKAGIPARVVQLETLPTPDALKGIDVLFMTYEGMKPLDPKYHTLLAAFVKAGGKLIVVDDQKDPYNAMRAWWNTLPNSFKTPLEHLIAACDNKIVLLNESPAHLAKQPDGAAKILALLPRKFEPKSSLVLRRGPYVIAANMDESPATAPASIAGVFVDLFDANLPIVTNPTLQPGDVKLYREVDSIPAVLASSSRIRDVRAGETSLTFTSRGPAKTICHTRIALPRAPKSVEMIPKPLAQAWDVVSSTLVLTHANQATPITIRVSW